MVELKDHVRVLKTNDDVIELFNAVDKVWCFVNCKKARRGS